MTDKEIKAIKEAGLKYGVTFESDYEAIRWYDTACLCGSVEMPSLVEQMKGKIK